MSEYTWNVIIKFAAFILATAILYFPSAAIAWDWDPGGWHWVLRSVFSVIEGYVVYHIITTDVK